MNKAIPKKSEEITPKMFHKLMDQFEKLNSEKTELKERLESKIDKIENYVHQKFSEIEEKTSREFADITKTIQNTEEKIEETIKVQEEIIMGMMQKFNDEFYKHKTTILKELESVKNEQDVLKISYTVNEKKFLETIKRVVITEFNKKIRGQEAELLMKIWMEDLKEIVSSFNKLKAIHPKEFAIQLKEISDTVKAFKQKIEIE